VDLAAGAAGFADTLTVGFATGLAGAFAAAFATLFEAVFDAAWATVLPVAGPFFAGDGAALAGGFPAALTATRDGGFEPRAAGRGDADLAGNLAVLRAVPLAADLAAGFAADLVTTLATDLTAPCLEPAGLDAAAFVPVRFISYPSLPERLPPQPYKTPLDSAFKPWFRTRF